MQTICTLTMNSALDTRPNGMSRGFQAIPTLTSLASISFVLRLACSSLVPSVIFPVRHGSTSHSCRRYTVWIRNVLVLSGASATAPRAITMIWPGAIQPA
jgi:hypothetical protein